MKEAIDAIVGKHHQQLIGILRIHGDTRRIAACGKERVRDVDALRYARIGAVEAIDMPLVGAIVQTMCRLPGDRERGDLLPAVGKVSGSRTQLVAMESHWLESGIPERSSFRQMY